MILRMTRPGEGLKAIALFVFIVLYNFNSQAQPAITSFSPAAAYIGDTIAIMGTNFGSTTTANVVYFGGVRATVVTASSNLLTVKVPAGAAYQSITITTNALTAYSRTRFISRSKNAGFPFTATSFDYRADPYNPTGIPINVAAADFDGDGKPDVALCPQNGGLLSVQRNISNKGKISLGPRITFTLGLTDDIAIADFNGDGKPDIVGSNYQFYEWLSVLINDGSTGTISFKPRIAPVVGYGQRSVAARDMDGDGRPDILVSIHSNQGRTISILRNTTSGSTISFAAPFSFVVRPNTNPDNEDFLMTEDLDGDGKPDLLATLYSDNEVAVLRNTSIPGNLSFASKQNFMTGIKPVSLDCGDLNGDGLPELVIANNGAGTVSVLQNASTAGAINFLMKQDITLQPATATQNVFVNDIDGDAKPDIIALTDKMVLIKNASVNGIVSMVPGYSYNADYTPRGTRPLSSIDFDGDEKTDVIVVYPIPKAIGIFRNQQPSVFELCANNNSILTSPLTGSSYQWQISPDGISYTNLSANTNYTGIQTATLQLVNIPSATYGSWYRCKVDTAFGDPFFARFVNYWTGAADNTWENPANWSCGTVPDSNTDVTIISGTVVISSNVVVRTLRINAGVNFTVTSGYMVTITH